MFGKRKRNLFKLNLRDKFSPIKYDKIKFHEVSVCFVRKQNRDEWKISPRNFTFIRLVLEIILFTSSRNFHFSSWHSLESSVAIFPSTIGIFSEDRKWIDFYSSSRWDPTGMERHDRERLRVLIEFPTLPDSNSTFISRFARESDPAEVRVSLISRLPPAEQQSISYRDRVIEKREDSCCHSRSKIKFPFPTFYLLEGASLSPTSTSKLHFPRVWSSRNASREIDSLNSIDEPSWRSGVRVLTSFIRLPSSLKACLRSREIKINELVEFKPNFSRNRRAECYLLSRKCLYSARKKKKREIISVSPYRWKISKEINERRCIIFVARVLSWFIGGNPFNPLRSRGDSQSPRRFDSLFTLDFSLRLIRARILTRFPYLFISLLGDNRELVL